MCNCKKNKNAAAPVRSRAIPVTPLVVQQRELTLVRRRPGRRGATVELRTMEMKPLEVVDTAIWGPSVWRILHVAAERGVSAPLLLSAIRALDGALPCPECREHYHAWLDYTPPPGTTEEIRRWLLDLHNDVNVRTNKGVWTETDLARTYGGSPDVTGALATLRDRIGTEGWRALRELCVTG
jgi:hypothetical protein